VIIVIIIVLLLIILVWYSRRKKKTSANSNLNPDANNIIRDARRLHRRLKIRVITQVF
jgi:type II secretory pathway pseudopilin PulG